MTLRPPAGKRLSIAVLLLPLLLIAAKPMAMLRSADEPAAFAAQLLLVLAVFLGPGLAAWPLTRKWAPDSMSGKFATLILHSIFVSAFVPWFLYATCLYAKPVAISFVALLYASLAFGAAVFPWRRALTATAEGFRKTSFTDKIGLFLCTLFLIVATARSLEPFTRWDSVVSWDKWGRDMAERNSLGRYVMGLYPQLISSLYSIFYGAFSTSDRTLIPDTTFVVHFMNGLFNWLAVPGAIMLCRKLKASFLLFSAIFFGNTLFSIWFDSGYVDTATTAVFLCLAGLVAELREDRSGMRWKRALASLTPAAAVLCFIKGQGYVLLIFIALFAVIWARSWDIRKSLPNLFALVLGFAFVLPYFLHQNMTWNAGRAETDLLLHTLPVRAGYPGLVTNSWGRALDLSRDFLTAYALPFAQSPTGYATACIMLFVAGFACSLRKRNVIPVALAAVACGYVWFIKSSYDWRNAHQVAAMVAVCIAAGLSVDFRNRRARIATATAHLIIAIAMCGSILVSASASALVSVSPCWRLPPSERPNAIFGPQFRFLSASPLASQAHLIFSHNVFVWLLGDKAVYGWHPFVARAVPQDGDIGAVERAFKNPAGGGTNSFVTISGFGLLRLDRVRPAYSPAAATVSREGFRASATPLPATISEPGVYFVSPEISVSGGDAILYSIEVENPNGANIKTLIGREWNDFTSYRNICNFIHDGDFYKATFWLDRAARGSEIASLPPIAISKKDDVPMMVKSVGVMVVKPSTATETTVQ